jgi:serine/threonine protein kinase
MREHIIHENQQLGHYRLLRLLGRGGFADVYLGEHVYLKSPAALKVLHRVLKGEDAGDFLREAQTLVRLSHPHIVRVLDFAIAEGTPFLVMEYAPHGTLRQRYPKGTRLPPETIVPYVQQVTSALQYAHDQRLVHRDVKPENMLLGAHDEVLLSDFGLAVLAPQTHPYSTHEMARQVAGTSPYLAPEQLRGRPRPASDQYALGVVVYEWFCGYPPFQGTPLEVAAQHMSMAPPPLQEQVPDLAPAIEEVVLKALAKEPQERFASVQEFAEALTHAYHTPPMQLASPAPTVEEPPSATASQVLQSTRKPEPMWKVPTILTPLIGREEDVAAICALLERPVARLLTLLGTGGIGKTRLGIQVAKEIREHFVDGIYFVQLASISNPDLVIPTIAEVLEVREIGKRPIFEQVKTYLQEKGVLLLLDNFEQVVMAAPLIEELLIACPRLKILVTSRAVLHVQGEQEFPVSPLALPDLKLLPERAALVQYAAVALFVQRAQAMLPTFQLSETNARAIAEMCVRLDGLPLAIELAAARIKLLPPQALLIRLSQRLQVLTGGARTLPVRQQTLRNTLKWSYDLLDAGEQRIFRLLSVFIGGCTLEAIEAIGQRAAGDETVDVLHLESR